jgi:hypothetical protein
MTIDQARVAYVDASASLKDDDRAAAALDQLLVDLMDAHEQTELEEAIIAAHDAFKAKLEELKSE